MVRGVSEGAAGAAAGDLPVPVHQRGGVRVEHHRPGAGQLPVGGGAGIPADQWSGEADKTPETMKNMRSIPAWYTRASVQQQGVSCVCRVLISPVRAGASFLWGAAAWTAQNLCRELIGFQNFPTEEIKAAGIRPTWE